MSREKVEITKKESNYLKNIYTDRLGELLSDRYKYSKIVQEPTSIKKDDTVYIFPNSRIKKLPLRKWIKAIGAKQVFNVSEANCIVVRDGLVTDQPYSSTTAFRVVDYWTLKKGSYTYKCGTEYLKIDEDRLLNNNEMADFVFNTTIRKSSHDYVRNHQREEIIDHLYKAGNYTSIVTIQNMKMNADHAKSILNPDVKMINDLDLQQHLYDWEVENDVRSDLSECNWDSLYKLLTSESGWNMGIKMIHKGNFELFLSKLVACFYHPDVQQKAKLKLWNSVFTRKPDLKECIVRKHMYNTYVRGYNISALFNECDKRNVLLNKDDFKEILDINLHKEMYPNGQTNWTCYN